MKDALTRYRERMLSMRAPLKQRTPEELEELRRREAESYAIWLSKEPERQRRKRVAEAWREQKRLQESKETGTEKERVQGA